MPAADEVHRLHKGRGAECDLFRKIAEQGHYAGRTVPTDTRQGIYATTADGRLLASINSTSAHRVAQMLEKALRNWDALTDDQRHVDSKEIKEIEQAESNRLERLYPKDGLILREYSRDLPRPSREIEPHENRREGRGRDRWKEDAWNRDYAWFRKSEMMSFVPEKRETGATCDVPANLVNRIASLHLVDNVRGQVSAFDARDVEQAQITSRIVEIEGDRITLQLEGASRTVHTDNPQSQGDEANGGPASYLTERGVETQILGVAEFDTSASQFTKFDLVALGKRWGKTRYNGRDGDEAPAGIAFAFTLATTDDPPVAPAFVWRYGW